METCQHLYPFLADTKEKPVGKAAKARAADVPIDGGELPWILRQPRDESIELIDEALGCFAKARIIPPDSLSHIKPGGRSRTTRIRSVGYATRR